MLGFGKKKKSDPLADFELPSFSAAVLNLLNKLRDPATCSNELAADLEIDPGLHVRVLRTVNSAAFGLSHKVSNIRHAVNLLGRGRLESLVLAVAVKDGLSRSKTPPWLNMQQFWAAASFRACLARCLQTNMQSDVFTIGLLQDMAIPLLASREQERYRELYFSWLAEDDYNLPGQEQGCFGTNHAALGAHMAQRWGFPDSLISAIREHHAGSPAEALPLAVSISAQIKSVPKAEELAELAVKLQQDCELAPELLSQQLTLALHESDELSAALN